MVEDEGVARQLVCETLDAYGYNAIEAKSLTEGLGRIEDSQEPVDELYRICRTARKILRGPHEVSRVIARPFIGQPGSFERTANRHDFSVLPPPQGTSFKSMILK